MTNREIEALYRDITDLKKLKSFIDKGDTSVISITMSIHFATKYPTTLGLDLQDMPNLQETLYDDIVSYTQELEEKIKTIQLTIKEET